LFGRASELAYSCLVAIFPLLLFLLSCFGLFASHSSELMDKLFFYFSRLLAAAAGGDKNCFRSREEQRRRKGHVWSCAGIGVRLRRYEFA